MARRSWENMATHSTAIRNELAAKLQLDNHQARISEELAHEAYKRRFLCIIDEQSEISAAGRHRTRDEEGWDGFVRLAIVGLNQPTDALWDLAHELGHILDGEFQKDRPAREQLKIELSAWESGRRFLASSGNVLAEGDVRAFEARREYCLNSYRDRVESQLRDAAVHEAGHVLVGVKMGLSLQFAQIDTPNETWFDPDDGPEQHEYARLCKDLAGLAANVLDRGLRVGDDIPGAQTDFDLARARPCAGRFRGALRDAISVLVEDWEAVAAIAHELIAQKREQPEAQAIVTRQTVAGLPPVSGATPQLSGQSEVWAEVENLVEAELSSTSAAPTS